MLVFGTFIPDSRFAGRSPLISLTNLLIARFGSPGRFGSSGRGSWNGYNAGHDEDDDAGGAE